MKKFWIIFGIVTALIIAMMFAGIIVAAVMLKGDVTFDNDQQKVLKLDFSNGVLETRPVDPFSRWTSQGSLTILELIQALELAESDSSVSGVVADLSFVNLGLSHIEEIHTAMDRFRESGKWSIAYADTYFNGRTGTGTYYLATAFDEIYMHPAGDVGFLGIAIQPYFLAGAFEKFGIKPIMGQRYEYKSMVNMYTQTGYTDPHREIEQRLLNSIFDHILDGVSKRRDIPLEELKKLMKQAPFLGQEALDCKLADGFKYWDELKTMMEDKASMELSVVDIDDYYSGSSDSFMNSGETVIALVHGVGEVVRGEASVSLRGNKVMASQTLSETLRQIQKDDDVDAVVFRVNSPGGSHDASATIAHEIKLISESGIPVIVSMSDVAASGGYYVAMYADEIMAQPVTITGSIGVAGGKFVVTDLLNRLGIEIDTIEIGENALLLSMFTEPSENEQAQLDEMLDRIYEDFAGNAMTARGMTPEQIDKLARGRVWSGLDAADNGLIDSLGGLYEALETAAEKAGASADQPITIRNYPREKTFLEMLKESNGSFFTQIADTVKTGARLVDIIDEIGLENFIAMLNTRDNHLRSDIAVDVQ